MKKRKFVPEIYRPSKLEKVTVESLLFKLFNFKNLSHLSPIFSGLKYKEYWMGNDVGLY